MSYIAGLNLSVSDAFLDNLTATTILVQFTALASIFKEGSARGNREAGPVKTMPKSRVAALSLPVHALGYFLPPIVYVGTVFVRAIMRRGSGQPAWMRAWSLPAVGPEDRAVLRIASCALFLGITGLMAWGGRVLGAQWHAIGVRERPKLVSSGPYSVVRHPMYTLVLVEEVLLTVMTWNYVPLVALLVTASAFAVKMPFEEQLMEGNESLGPQYKKYKKRVRSRIIPYIW